MYPLTVLKKNMNGTIQDENIVTLNYPHLFITCTSSPIW
jgi:hypothetical protein